MIVSACAEPEATNLNDVLPTPAISQSISVKFAFVIPPHDSFPTNTPPPLPNDANGSPVTDKSPAAVVCVNDEV